MLELEGWKAVVAAARTLGVTLNQPSKARPLQDPRLHFRQDLVERLQIRTRKTKWNPQWARSRRHGDELRHRIGNFLRIGTVRGREGRQEVGGSLLESYSGLSVSGHPGGIRRLRAIDGDRRGIATRLDDDGIDPEPIELVVI